jgi:hypothetical protein
MGLHSGRVPALSANIRLGWKRMAVTNTLAYYNTATITTVKRFIVQQLEVSRRFVIPFTILGSIKKV